MIPACSSRGARSLVPEILVPTRPSKSSIPSATPYSVTEVPRTGMVLVPACAACRAGVQVNIIRNKAIDDGAAGVGIALGVLFLKGDGIAELLGQGILKPLGCSVQSNVLHQLADADLVGLAVSSGGIGSGGGFCGRRSGAVRSRCSRACCSAATGSKETARQPAVKIESAFSWYLPPKSMHRSPASTMLHSLGWVSSPKSDLVI